MKINSKRHFKLNVRKLLYLLQALMVYLISMLNAKLAHASSSSSIGHYQNDQAQQFLNKIMFNDNNDINNNNKVQLKTNHDDLNKQISFFLSQITTTSSENTCNSKMLQSNIQSKMRILKSII